MTSLTANRSPATFAFTGARIAVLGYDADARDCALALVRGGNRVTIGVPHGACRSRAEDDGLPVASAAAAVDGANIIVVVVRDPEPVWQASRAYIEPGALVIVSCAYSLESGAFDGASTDVALVTGAPANVRSPCRIAVHRDVTGRALLRAIGFVHAVYGTDMPIEATTVSGEIDRELAGVAERVGSMLALSGGRADDDRVTVTDLIGYTRSRA
jgi:ketol-acid reductoisomerase